jgi:tRNA-dihydrouridine synthase B
MKLNKIELRNNLWFAPLAGYSHKAMRLMVKRYGAGFTVSEMVSVEGLWRKDKKTLKYIDIDDGLTAIQLFGSATPQKFYEVSKMLVEKFDVKIIDINFGCPVKKVVRNGAGSALLKSPENMGELIKAVKDSGATCTAKIRLGYDYNNLEKTVPIIEKSGADIIILHPRLGIDFFRGYADWREIARVREMTKLPLIANGDITTPEDAKKVFETTHANGIMIGRGAIGKPFLFRQIIDYLTIGSYKKYSMDEIKTIMREFAELFAEVNKTTRIVAIRGALIQYVKGFHDCKNTRYKLSLVSDLNELERVLEGWHSV